MANAVYINITRAQEMLDAFTAAMDAGAGAATLKIYDGTRPTYCGEAVGAQVLLAELAFSDPAFPASSDDDTPNALATANTVNDDSSADATGTASWFRIEDSDGNDVLDGTVGDSGSWDLLLNTVSITAGSTVSVTSMTMTMPEGASV